MEKLFYRLINAWLWLRIAGAWAIVGAGLGAWVWHLVGGTHGLATGSCLAVLAIYAGVRFANQARREDRLAEVADALPARRELPAGGRDGRAE